LVTESNLPEAQQKPRPLVDLLVSIIIPSVVLMKFSGPDKLGATWGLVVALAFPVAYGLWELIINKKRNWIAVLGIVSVLLTGGIGLFKIDTKWLAIKEAAIPAIIGIGVLVASIEKKLDGANNLFAGTFAFSAVMNFILAKWLVKSESGTSAFNEELGRMTLLSYPMIAIPSMIMMVGIFFYIWRTANKLTGLTLEEMVVTQNEEDNSKDA